MSLSACVAILLCVVGAEPACGQKKDDKGRVLFGVSLNGHAASLLEEVERLFSARIREEWLDDPNWMSGKSMVSEDGTPTIQVNRDNGKTLDVIVHELYHLKLKGQGYPAVDWRYPQAMDTDANRAAFAQLAEQVHDPIEHYMFYDAIRAWGINPGEAFEKRTYKILEDGSLPATFARMDRGAVALYYFKIRLEVRDAVLVRRIEESLKSAGKHSGIEFGEQLSEIVSKASPKSPEEEIAAMVDCLNVFYLGKFQFRQLPWTTRQLGDHTQRVAQIELVPLP